MMTVEQAMEKINNAQQVLRDLDFGLRRARAQDWADDAVPHEMAVAGRLVRDQAWIEANSGLTEVYMLLRSHIEGRVVTDEMAERAVRVWFNRPMTERGATSFIPDMKEAIKAALGVGK